MPSASSRTVLILPRVIGLVVAMPLLAVIADGIGLTSGALLCKWLLDMPLVLYLERAGRHRTHHVLGGHHQGAGLRLLDSPAPTAASRYVIPRASSAASLPLLVVQSIFLVIFANAMFAIAFWQLDI